MKISKALNNNIVLVKDANGSDCIYQGLGIGFQKKRGDSIDESLIERKFTLETETESRHFETLLSEIPEEYWTISLQAIDYAREHFKFHISDRTVLPLCDHLACCTERIKNHVQLSNPLLFDIQRIYPKEYECGKYTISLIQDQLKIELPDDEAAFIAYHFINATSTNQVSVDTDSSIRLIGSVFDIVSQSFQIELDVDDWNYQRFLTHLRFFAGRILNHSTYEEPEDSDLFEELSERCRPVRNCVDKIADYILINYHYDISTDEKMYLLIHIERVTRKYRKHK